MSPLHLLLLLVPAIFLFEVSIFICHYGWIWVCISQNEMHLFVFSMFAASVPFYGDPHKFNSNFCHCPVDPAGCMICLS